MFNIYIWVSAALALVFIILGIVVVTRNAHSRINRIFLAFSILIAGWLVTNYIGGDKNISPTLALIDNRLVFVFGILTAFSLMLFMKNLVSLKGNNLWNGLIVANILTAATCFTPLIVKEVERNVDTYTIIFGPLSSIYFLLLIVNLLASVSIAILARRKARGPVKPQVDTILASLAITLGAVIITNGLLPFLFNFYALVNAGSFFTTILVTGIAYSMIRHKLFDIRTFAVRAFAYSLTFAAASLIYMVPTFLLTAYIAGRTIDFSTLILLVPVTLITAFYFQPLKTYFNRATGKLFFRDYYEAQDVLDKLSSLLVGSVEVKQIEKESSLILKNALKPDFLRYLLIAENQDDDSNEILAILRKINDDMVVFDELDPVKGIKIRELFSKNDVSLAVRLRTQHEELGYMLLGFKQSGSAYSGNDKKLLRIVADEVAVGLQSALRFEEISQFNLTLQAKIEDATQEIRKANIKLRELDKTKDEFISMASHQLRTPLTAVKGYLSMVLEEDTGKIKKEQRDLLQRSFDGADRMVYLIADLLNVSRLQSGKFVIENKPTDLVKIVSAEVDQLQESAANHQIKLSFHKPDKFPERVLLDETKIHQVVMNFMDNAIYYTPAGGSVEVALSSTDKEIIYTVTDTGLGVPKAEQHHLFAKFYRAGNARKMRPDGTGLGLYMAKKVIIAQGGAVIFKSTEGKGSVFGFSFPLHKIEVKS
ncbi:hypothetical protein H0X09_01085 [Candidatus Saccharibacteria bacterium]|nr:hypothetical protein [Candidatus Saccharibacteria bacterium]